VKIATALLSGILFGVGLATADMTNPAKVISFLDVAGGWDPSLALVMGAAVVVSALGTGIARRRASARDLGSPLPGQGPIDARLVGGAACFGLGWGLAGFCPGAALAALSTGSVQVLLFVVAMIVGMGGFHLLGPVLARRVPRRARAC
jgi:hypothetical protein